MAIFSRFAIDVNIFDFDVDLINELWDQFKLGRMFNKPVYGYFDMTDNEIDQLKENSGPISFRVRMSVPKRFYIWVIEYLRMCRFSFTILVYIEYGYIVSYTDLTTTIFRMIPDI